jgi:DnaJ family protein A protein 2
MNAQAQAQAQDDLYSLLGVSRSADDDEIRKSYRKLCLTHHPDKGGKVEFFQKIQTAYEILSNPEKKQMYDTTGSIDEQPHMGGGVDIGSIFANMFGNNFNPFDQVPGMPGRTKRQKPQSKIHEIPVSLKDFYYGKQFKIHFERQKFCEGCKGEGYSTFNSCSRCNGRGVVEQHMMVGPGMMAVSRGPCESCNGKGKSGSNKCKKCNGNKYFSQEKVLDIQLEGGMKKGDSLLFNNECSDDPNFQEPGDVHIFFTEADESIDVSRDGNNLIGMCNISFTESILGTSFIIKNHPKYPNGFEIKIPKGTMNGETIIVLNEGMPKRYSKQFGNFLLKVDIIISESEKEILLIKEKDLRNIFNCED